MNSAIRFLLFVAFSILLRVPSSVAISIARGPYLQLSTPTSIVIRWRTDLPTDSRVIYGPATNALATTNFTATTATEHEAMLAGLTPDTRYFYAVGTNGANLAGPGTNYFFATHPLPGSARPARVWVIGDAGTGDANQTQVRDAFYSFNGTNQVNVWLQLGDDAYNAGLDSEFQLNMFNIYSNLLRNTVTWPTLGNHETAQSTVWTDTYPHFLVFTLPSAAEAGGVVSGTEHYYSFDYGMVHFICLDSMTANRSTNTPASGVPGAAGAMAQWLRDDLAANTGRWTIAYWHHPPYTKGSHNSDTETQLVQMRENFLPILEAGGVDLVLGGHSHVYERTCLINGHYGLSGTFTNSMIIQGGTGRDTAPYLKPEAVSGPPIGNRGAVYVVCGNSGGSGSLLTLPTAWSSMMQARFPGSGTTHGSLVLDITTNRLDARFITQDYVTSNDWFTILKENWPPTASNATVNVLADSSTNLVLAGSDINRNTLNFAAATSPTNGLITSLNPTNGVLTYTPVHGSGAGDLIQFVVSDGSLNSTGLVTIAITPQADANTNGIPDYWEALFGISNAVEDTDSDGVSNLNEYWAGTNPTNPLSWLRATEIATARAGFQLAWSSVGATRYRVSYSDGDADGGFNGAFTSIPRGIEVEMDTGPVGFPGTMSFTDDYTLTGGSPPANGRRYYRISAVR